MIYKDIDEFYDENPARRSSGEADYGCWWTDGRPWPRYRVSYVQATGEVYAVQLQGPGQVEVLGVVPPDADQIYYRTLNRILDGWADLPGHPSPLSWVRQRL